MRNGLIGGALCLTVLLGACSQHGGRPRAGFERMLRPIAEPGEVVAAELSFARAAQDKGQWTAFAEYAANDAVMFVPQPVLAKDWLKGRANPAQAVTWQPYQVWSSCDGTVAVTKGAWQQPDGTPGYFTTVWQRQEDGSYKWVLDQGATVDQALEEPDMVQSTVADCPQRRAPGDRAAMPQGPGPLPGPFAGQSVDGTLTWQASAGEGEPRELHVSLQIGGEQKEVLTSVVPAKSG